MQQIRDLCIRKKKQEDMFNQSYSSLINNPRVLEKLKSEAEIFNKAQNPSLNIIVKQGSAIK